MAGHAECRLCGSDFEQYGRTSPRTYCKRCAAKADRRAAMVLTVRCGECGKGFSTKTATARYCSDGCRSEAKRRKGREYMQKYLSDPVKQARFLARSRAHAAALRERKRQERGRRQGGHGGRQGRPPAGRGTTRLPRTAANGRQLVCRLCGTSFAPYGGTTTRAYCKACTAKADRETNMTMTVQCKTCGKAFSTKSRTVRYCSATCSTEGRRKSERDSNRRHMADPEKRAVAAARIRAWSAAQRDKKRGVGNGGGRGGGGARTRETA